MFYQTEPFLRLLVILIPQPFIAILFFFLSFKLLDRKTTRPTLTLASFYVLTAFGFIFNALTQFLAQMGLETIRNLFYFISSYLLLLGFIFIPLFIITIFKTELEFKKRSYILIVIIYAILSALLYLTPEGIEFKNGIVFYSGLLFILVNIFFTLCITLPTFIFSLRLYSTFKDKNLKKKLRIFLFGVIQALVIFYGVVLLNITPTFHIYRSIWYFIAFFLLVSGGLCIYYGLGRDL